MRNLLLVIGTALSLWIALGTPNHAVASKHLNKLHEMIMEKRRAEYGWSGLTPEERARMLREDLRTVDLYKLAETPFGAGDPSTMTELERWLHNNRYEMMEAKYGEQGKTDLLLQYAAAHKKVREDREKQEQERARLLSIIGAAIGVPIVLVLISLVWRGARRLAPAAVNQVVKNSRERERAKAQDELLRYKRLLDEGILTEEEYASKKDELKKLIL